MAEQKEVRFFDRHADRGLAWYEQQFEMAGDAVAVGEATQTYLYDPEAQDAMAAAVPDAKLIAILRDPVDRAYSHYWLNRERGKEPLSFADAIAAEPQRLDTTDKGARFVYSYLDRGRYVHQLDRLCERYPRSALHVLLLDDFRADPVAAYRGVCTFLEVDTSFVPPTIDRSINAFRHVWSPALRRLGKRLPSPLGRAIARLNSSAGSYEPLDSTLRERLRAGFAADTAALSTWLGRDLSDWDA